MSSLDDWELPGVAARYGMAAGRKLGRQVSKAKFAQKRADWIKANPQVGLWTILQDLGSPAGEPHAVALCRCACGKEKKVYINSLRFGKSKGCGCTRKKRG